MTRIELKKLSARVSRLFSVTAVLAVMMLPTASQAAIDGVAPVAGAVTLTASEGHISIADGGSIYTWGYAAPGGSMQLPGPTLILTQGVEYTVTLDNALPAAAGNVSIVFPGHDVTLTSGGDPGLLTQEAPSGGSVSYTFTAGEPGTYQYHSGTRPELQVEMGLYGAIVVRPSVPGCAYNHADTCFDREYLFLLSEIDLRVHQMAEDQSTGPGPIDIGTGAFNSEYWLLNGRAAPDTMAPSFDPILPNQPYNSFPRMHPGERVLLRIVGAGREMHPFHTHGNHVRVLARDGRLLLSDMSPATASPTTDPLAGPLLFTVPSAPGGTVDAIFEWTGEDLGWDMYGHSAGDSSDCDTVDGQHSITSDPNYGEWCDDHNVAIPVDLPSLSSLAFGGFYSGSPFLGGMGSLPPGEGGLNPAAGFSYMWHSHNERELVNNDVFPGGMMTMLIIEAPSVDIIDIPRID
jgi:FtsP/CotA-like multicopper oxidase with cupredoxin domain